jgi:hypothetical protein
MERLQLTQGGHDEYQCDAREAGLARAFEMEDQSFRLGDHGRYADLHVSLTLRLTGLLPVVLTSGCL